MALFSALKRGARLVLRGNWQRAAGLVLILSGAALLLYLLQTLALSFFVSPMQIDLDALAQYGAGRKVMQQFAQVSLIELGINGGFLLLELLLLAPLGLGVTWWYVALIHGQNVSLGDVLHYFASIRGYGRAIWLSVQLTVRQMLWAIAFFCLPGGILVACLSVAAQGDISRGMRTAVSWGAVFACVLFLLALLLYLALMNKYALAAYLVCESDSIGVRAAIRQSARATRGFRFSLLWFSLSFAGWVLLCVFIVPLLFVVPYFNTAMMAYARHIVERGQMPQPDPTQEFRREGE